MRQRLAIWIPLAAIVIACLPTLVFKFLPMTDLPQHTAVASILAHHRDPTYGFDEFYVVDWLRTPYVLPYAIAVAIGRLASVPIGMHVVVFLSTIAFPVAIYWLLRVAGKPSWFALLAIPLVYNRAFFWGFINFNLAIGLALGAFALCIDDRNSRARNLIHALLVLAAAFTHIYGIALSVLLMLAYAICGGGAVLRTRPSALIANVLGIAVWAIASREQAGYGMNLSPSFGERLRHLPDEILGGYQDSSELLLLALFGIAVVLLCARNVPLTVSRYHRATPLERVAVVVFAGNLLLYFVLPQATWTAKFIHFRHAFLALSLIPVLARPLEREHLARAITAVAAGGAIVIAWGHLALFNAEARRIEPVLAQVPRRARIVSLTFDPNGDVMKTWPYLHFSAYAQAEHGGIIAMTFPDSFWNLPVTLRLDVVRPKTPEGLEWNPNVFSEKQFGYFYDTVLVRMPGNRSLARTPSFPFDLVTGAPPWQLYRRGDPSSVTNPQ